MAKRVAKNKRIIIDAYTDFLLRNSRNPDSVYAFMSDLEMKEAEFYKYFGSFDGINKFIFQSFFENTLELLEKDESYSQFEPKDKLLSFYYTYFEVLTANRSYVQQVLGHAKNPKEAMEVLSEMRKDFIDYVEKIGLPTVDLKIENVQSFANKTRSELFWNQLLITMKFWMDDSSPNFEKTDIFIEKSINTGFSLANVEPLENLLDLGKFLFKERVGVKS